MLRDRFNIIPNFKVMFISKVNIISSRFQLLRVPPEDPKIKIESIVSYLYSFTKTVKFKKLGNIKQKYITAHGLNKNYF